MASATETRRVRPLSGPALSTRVMNGLKDRVPLVVLILLVVVGWEAIKLVGGNPWRINTEIFGQPVQTVLDPPYRFRFANDLNMPHLWDIAAAFARPAQRGGDPLGWVLLEASLFTFRVALVGFAIGTVAGLSFAIILVHSQLLNRALVPYIVASQTIPILVVAPIIVIWLQSGWISVSVIAAYLTFFPVTISALRGFRSLEQNMLDLMHTYAASNREILFKVRFPNAIPYLFVGFKIAATASVVGTIVGELPSGIPNGLGASVLNFAQYYTTGPPKLWATIVMAGALGIMTYSLVLIAESVALRHQPRDMG